MHSHYDAFCGFWGPRHSLSDLMSQEHKSLLSAWWTEAELVFNRSFLFRHLSSLLHTEVLCVSILCTCAGSEWWTDLSLWASSLPTPGFQFNLLHYISYQLSLSFPLFTMYWLLWFNISYLQWPPLLFILVNLYYF